MSDKYHYGDKVSVHGYPGYVVREYLPGMYEVRLRSGLIVVPDNEIHPRLVGRGPLSNLCGYCGQYHLQLREECR